MNSGSAKSSPTAARSTVETSWTAFGGKPHATSSPAKMPCSARLVWKASFPPRKITALPLLMQSAAASAVTSGRLS